MTAPEPAPPADDAEAGDPSATDTGDVAGASENERAEVEDPDLPANDPVDLSDVEDDGQVIDIGGDDDGGG